MRNNLKLICMEDKVALMPIREVSASRVRLVDGGCNSFINPRSGRVWRATKEQKISTQVWRIPHEKISINVVRERPEEAEGVYKQGECPITAGMGKYIHVETNRRVKGDVLIEIGDKTMLGLILPEIVYNVKKKLGCIFVENHNSETIILKKEQSIGLVTLCLVTQEEQGQLLVKRKEDKPSLTERSKDTDTRIGGPSVENAEKAGWKAYSVQSTENRQFYETKGEQRQFICESF